MENGTRLGPYEIQGPLGAGGMGEVYLAQDTRLGRQVAVKILPAEFAADPERLARFEQEARAAAALNHPNIAAVFDVGVAGEENDRTRYMVQEYLEGQTLGDLLADGPLPRKRALQLGAEIAAALAAAHAAGIVHRDLKPANVFVSPEGSAKVLDFGLAKLTEAAAAASGDGSMSPTMIGTMAGAVMGTAGYMAPEQVGGEEVDRRADIFAFGCVLHEMLAGQRAFAGKSVPDTLARILHEEPETPADLGHELARLLQKCLSKDPADRYQHADDLLVDLRFLGTLPPTAAVASLVDDAERPGVGVGLAAVLALSMLGIGVVGGRLTSPDAPAMSPVRPTPIKITDFSTMAEQPVISPNGQMVAFLASDPADGWPQVYVKPLPDGPPLRLTSTPDSKDFLAFSPDGAQVSYAVIGEDGWNTWTVPLTGGGSRLWLRNANSLTWTSDGRILFSRFKIGRHLGIVRADASGGNPEEIWFPPLEPQMAHMSHLSPDGTRIAIGYMGSTVDRGVRCFVAPVDDVSGEPPSLDVGPDAPPCGMGSRWSPDGRWLYYESALGAEIWRVPAAGGNAEPVIEASPGIETLSGFAIAPDGRSLIYGGGTSAVSIWIRDPTGAARQLTFETSARQPAMSKDGSRVFYQRESGSQRSGPVWSYDLTSGLREPVCPGLDVTDFTLARDVPRLLAQAPGRRGMAQPWLCFWDASEPPRDLGARVANSSMLLAHDGTAFYYTAADEDGRALYSQSVEEEEPVRIRDLQSGQLLRSLSPDGRWLVLDGGFGERDAMWLFPVDGGEPRLALRGWRLSWNQASSAFLFSISGRHPAVWSLPNPGGDLLPPGMPESPGPDWFRAAGARRLLAEFDFIDFAPSPRSNEIVFTRRLERGNLYRVEIKE